MPNNGTYNRTMGSSALTLPAGYYAGGTINPPSFTTMSEYSTCLNISNNIIMDELSSFNKSIIIVNEFINRMAVDVPSLKSLNSLRNKAIKPIKNAYIILP